MVVLWRATDHHYQILFRIFHNPNVKWNFAGTDVMADALLWGCCLAFFRPRLSASISTAATILSAALLTLYTMGVRIPMTPHNIELILTVTHMLPAIMLGSILACTTGPIGRFLELAPLRYIGKLSYSLYIWQQLFLGGPGLKLTLPLALCAAFACAYLSYRFIEQPSIRLGKQLIKGHSLLPEPI
jgi:peptidoglycan/LPS O-acetylase OafA/YrhL